MKRNELYEVMSEIKIHTKPMRKAVVIRSGVFQRETPKEYIFNTFRARKENIISIRKFLETPLTNTIYSGIIIS